MSSNKNTPPSYRIRYPPFTERKFRVVKMLSPKHPFYSVQKTRYFLVLLAGFIFGALATKLFQCALQHH